ncbi:MAG TPA: Maf family protein [Candidatus Thermoplasmatota archaeon]|nr:Maf family protein [Candidatus Thermoplasmatota archaeon]
MQVVLASQSPRRAVLLRHLLDTFTIDAVPVDEVAPRGLPVGEALEVIARKKALAASARHPDAMVLGADTVVVVGDALVGKARDEAQARERLALLAGMTHQVWTGLALAWDGKAVDAAHAVSAVRMDRLPQEALEDYIASRQWEGKAGGYGIQDPRLAPHVRVMAGPWSNVVGLPLAATRALLERNRIACKPPPSEAWLQEHNPF